MPSFRLPPVPISPIVTGNHCRISPGLLVVGAGFSPATIGLWPIMFLTPPNKSKALHYLRLDSGVLRAFRVAATTAQSAFASWVERRLFRLVSSWLDFPLHRVGASDPESKPLEEVMRLIKPQGRRELFKAPSMKTGKPPVARLLSGAACCQAAIRYYSCYRCFRSCLSINSLGYCSVSSAFVGRPSKIAE